MSFSIGIVGLPNVGKSTLFQTLTKKQVNIANYPFCTIEPNVGIVEMPDERIEKLYKFSHSEKKIHAVVEFVDIAGLVKDAHKGEGLGNQFLSHIREVKAIIYVLRGFENSDIIDVQQNRNIIEAKEILDTELMLKDLETVTNRLSSLEREAKSGEKAKIIESDLFKKFKEKLESGVQIRNINLEDDEKKILKQYQFLTSKPCIYLINGKDEEISKSDKKYFEDKNLRYLIIDIKSEFDLADMTIQERKALGVTSEPGLDLLIKESYKLLGLMTFLTTGEDETRAWTIRKNTKAPQAAAAIHTDFEKKFIRAEVINWQDLINAGSYKNAREKGLVRIEGKNYIVQDGDVVTVKI